MSAPPSPTNRPRTDASTPDTECPCSVRLGHQATDTIPELSRGFVPGAYASDTTVSSPAPPDPWRMSESDFGIVVIGRNEGKRLYHCLASVCSLGVPVVYVDSGSADGSAELARSMGTTVIELDRSAPFTAARARNAGFDRLLRDHPDVSLVQFIDGDCILTQDWLGHAERALAHQPDLAAVCGQLRERYPEQSIYHRLARLEFDRPTGDIEACDGVALMRASAFRQIRGFEPSLIAGEEYAICFLLRAQGWRIARLDAEMAHHDMAMTRFSQWWQRSVRTGYTFAQGASIYGWCRGRPFVRHAISDLFWVQVVPLATLVPAWSTRGASLVLLVGYLVLFHRIARRGRMQGRSAADARLYALACILGKLPHLVGMVRFWVECLTGKRSGLIEYK